MFWVGGQCGAGGATLGYPEDFPKTEEGQAASKAMRERFVATDLPQFLGYFEALLEGHSFAVGGQALLHWKFPQAPLHRTAQQMMQPSPCLSSEEVPINHASDGYHHKVFLWWLGLGWGISMGLNIFQGGNFFSEL